MCISRRFIFTQCGHHTWGTLVRVCDQQIAFQTSPSTSIECDTMYSHPMHSYKFAQVCRECEKKRGKTAETAEKLKQALKDIRESVERMEKMQAEQQMTETAKEILAEVYLDDVAALESWD